MSRVRRLSYAISEEGRRAQSIDQARRIRDAALSMVEEANLSITPTRRITKKSAFTVVLRSLEKTRNLPFSLRQHMALKELSTFINLAQSNKSNSLTLANTDLLPVAHPRSTRNHSMTASALREARVRWYVDNPAIKDDYARTVLASALIAEIDSPEFTYYNALLSSLPQGEVPLQALLAAFGDGNSPMNRSLRAQLQRRDRLGRFAFQGGGIKNLIKRASGIFSLTGRTLADLPDGRVQIELADGRIVAVNPEVGEYTKAVLPGQSKDGFSPKPVRNVSIFDKPMDEKDLEFFEAPNGWEKDADNPNIWSNENWKVEVQKDDAGNRNYAVTKDGEKVFDDKSSWADVLDGIDDHEQIADKQPEAKPEQKEEKAKAPAKKFEFNYPENAYKLRPDADYSPEGRVDENSPDFTDDPAELAQRYDVEDLRDALEEGVLPQEDGQPALGYGVLPFGRGNEYVPADALYLALKEAGEDNEMELARIYDKQLGGNDNETALNDARKGDESVGQSTPDVAESFKRETEISPDEETPAEEPAFIEEKRDETPLPPLLEGLDENELARFVESKDHTPHLPENKTIEDVPDGYAQLDEKPFESWRESTKENPIEGLPEGFSDNPVFLAQNISKEELSKELRRSVEPGNEMPGYANISIKDSDGEDFVANIPGEAVRDALQLQGVDTNAELEKIYDEGRDGQRQGINDSEAGRIIAEIEKEEGPDAFEQIAEQPSPLNKPENKEALDAFKRQYVKDLLNEEEALADKLQEEEDMPRGDAQAVAETEMKKKYGKTAFEALNELSREDALRVLDEREQENQAAQPSPISEKKNIPSKPTPDFDAGSLAEVPDGNEENVKPADVEAVDPVNPDNIPPQRVLAKVTDLKPGDITVGDHFVITEIGEKVPGTDRVKIKGYYPGHVEQDTKQWNEWREIPVIRGAQAPEKGELPVLSKPKEKDFGKRKLNKETGQWEFANPEDQAKFDAAMAEYNVQLDAAKKRFADPTEPSNNPHRVISRAADLKPGDITTDPKKGHFVIERVFTDENTKSGFVSVEGYYPGHVTQRKEWKVDTQIDVIRNVEAPAKGDLPELHRPAKEVNGRWRPDNDKAKNAEHQKALDEAAARWKAPENLPVVDQKVGGAEEDKDIPNAVAIARPTPPRQIEMPAFQGDMAGIAREAGGDWKKFRELLAGRDVIFFDWETTGIQPEDGNEPWQVAAVRYRDGKIVDRINIFMNPGRSIADAWAGRDTDGKPNAVDADGNKLTDEFLAKQISQEEAMKQLLEWAGPGQIWGAYNTGFDDEIARRIADRHGLDWSPAGLLDVLPMARDIYKDQPAENQPKSPKGRKSFSLGPLANHLGVKIDNWHAADADTEALAGIFNALIDKGIEFDAGKDLFDVDARNDEYIKKLDDFNIAQNWYEDKLAEYNAAKALRDALAGKEVNLDEVIKNATSTKAENPAVEPNMGPVDVEPDMGRKFEEPVVLDFTPNVDFPRGKMRMMEREWILNDDNTFVMPRDDARMRDLLPGDFMQSKDGQIVWQVVAVRAGEEFGLEPGRVKIYRRNVDTGEISTYEHWHGTRLDNVRRAINPRDLDAPKTAAPEEKQPSIINAEVDNAKIEAESKPGDVTNTEVLAVPGIGTATITIKKNENGKYSLRAAVYDKDGNEIYVVEDEFRTVEGAHAEAKALIKEHVDRLIAQQREEKAEPAESRAKDVPISRGTIPADAESAPRYVEVENLPGDVAGDVKITPTINEENKPEFTADAVVKDGDGEVVASQSTVHPNEPEAEAEGRDFVNRAAEAISNPEAEPAAEEQPVKKTKSSKKPLSEEALRKQEEEAAKEKDNNWVEANAGRIPPIEAQELQPGDFLWEPFWGNYAEILEARYIGYLDRVEFKVLNRVNGKVEDRFLKADSPIRNVRRLGAEDQTIIIEPEKKGTNRGARRGVVKRKPLDERVVAKTGRPMGGRFDIEGFFKDKNGNPLAPGDVVMHPKYGRGVVKKREGAQVKEGEKAGGIVRKGKVYLDGLMIQFEGENQKWVLDQGGRIIKAKNLEKVEEIDSPINLPDFRGGRKLPNLKPVAKQQELIEVKKPEPVAEAPKPEANLPKQILKANVADKKGKEYDISIIKIGDKYEAAAFPKDGAMRGDVIAKADALADVQAVVNRFIEDVVDAEDGNKVLRSYAGISEPEVQPVLTAPTAVVPPLPAKQMFDLKGAKLRAKDIKARILDKEFVDVPAPAGWDDAKLKENLEYRRRKIAALLGEDAIDRRQGARFGADMRRAATYAKGLGWFEEARELEALANLQKNIPLRKMDDEFNGKVAEFEKLFPDLFVLNKEIEDKMGWAANDMRRGLRKNFDDVIVFPDAYNPVFRNALVGGKNNVDALIQLVKGKNGLNDDERDALLDRLEKVKAGLEGFGELPKLPLPQVGSDTANQFVAKVAREFEGMSADVFWDKNGNFKLQRGAVVWGDWKFKSNISAGINGLILLENSVTKEQVLIKYDKDKYNNKPFKGNGIKAEEIVAQLYKDLGFASPAAKAVNPDSPIMEVGGIGVMEFAGPGFFGLQNIKNNGEIYVSSNDIAPEHKAELLDFIVANAIIGNTDRHGHNFMWGRDANGKLRLVPVDNGLAMFNGAFGDADKHDNDPLFLNPIKVVLGRYGNKNAVIPFAAQHIGDIGEAAAVSQVVEFATRMRERAAAMQFVDPRAAAYIDARADYIIKNASEFVRRIK